MDGMGFDSSPLGPTYPVTTTPLVAGGQGVAGQMGDTFSYQNANWQADIAWSVMSLRERAVGYVLHSDYYHGRHRLIFATDRWKNTFGPLFRKFFDNTCRTVVDTTVDKLAVTGFREADASSDGQQDFLWELWQNLNMQRKSRETHLEMLRTGDSYVIVQQDEVTGDVEIYPQLAEFCTVRYDPDHPDRVAFGFKWWALTNGFVRCNLYYPDGTLKFITKKSVQGDLPLNVRLFQPWSEQPIVPNPSGVVPLFHFANRAETAQYGISELEDIIPLQDALNKGVIDMLVAMEFMSFPQRWATGIEVQTDPDTGQPIMPFTPGVDRLWTSSSSETAFGQFDSGDFDKYISILENFRLEIARVSATPVHYMMLSATNFPSGEAMKTAEARHTAKVELLQTTCGEQWENVMSYAATLSGHPIVGNAPAKTQWKPATPRSEQVFYTNLQVKGALGVPNWQLQREMGYSEDEIVAFMADAQANAQFQASLNAQMFSQGQQPEAAGGEPGASGAPQAGVTTNDQNDKTRAAVAKVAPGPMSNAAKTAVPNGGPLAKMKAGAAGAAGAAK